MTRKDFELIADTINKVVDLIDREKMARLFADALAKTNPGFKRQRFLDACLK